MSVEQRKAVYLVQGQKITYSKKDSYSGSLLTNTLGVYEFEFRTDSEWTEFDKVALYLQATGVQPIYIELTDTNIATCTTGQDGNKIYTVPVPEQMLTKAGQLTVGLIGYYSNQDDFRFPTNTDSSYRIAASVQPLDGKQYPQYISIMEQILLRLYKGQGGSTEDLTELRRQVAQLNQLLKQDGDGTQFLGNDGNYHTITGYDDTEIKRDIKDIKNNKIDLSKFMDKSMSPNLLNVLDQTTSLSDNSLTVTCANGLYTINGTSKGTYFIGLSGTIGIKSNGTELQTQTLTPLVTGKKYGLNIFEVGGTVTENGFNLGVKDSAGNTFCNNESVGSTNNQPAYVLLYAKLNTVFNNYQFYLSIEEDRIPDVYFPYGEKVYRKIKPSALPDVETEAAYEPDYVWTDYALFIKNIYHNKIYNDAGFLVDDANKNRSSTEIVPLQREQDMFSNATGGVKVYFYDEQQQFISKGETYYRVPIYKENYPENAKFVSFTYYRDSVGTDNVMHIFNVDNQYLGRKPYPTTKKIKGVRPRIDIKLSDTQQQIIDKFMDAYMTEDCDVVFECGTYNWSTIWDTLANDYQWNTAYELPIGGNCNYDLNNSTIIATPAYTVDATKGNSSVFGTGRRTLFAKGYTIKNGTIIGNDTTYIIHDEQSGSEVPYVRNYDNLHLIYRKGGNVSYLSRCIGSGSGTHGRANINRCIFETDHTANEVAWHGCQDNNQYEFMLCVTNSVFVNVGLLLDTLYDNGKGICIYTGNIAQAEPKINDSKWTLYK